jgi:cell division protein FtsQ
VRARQRARRHGRGGDDPRPSWEARHAALESVRERLRRQGAAARRRARVRRIAPAAALAACGVGALVAAPLLRAASAAHPELFAVRELAVVGVARLDPSEVARAAGLGADPRADAIAADALAARLLRHPWIAAARAARVSPDTVVVRIVERVPAAIWVRGPAPDPAGGSDEQAESWLVDAEGRPFAAAGGDDLPRLRLDAIDIEPCREAGSCPPDPRLAAGVALARAVERAGFARPEIELDGSGPADPAGRGPRMPPVLRLAGVAPRVLLGDGALEPQLERLTRVLADVPASRAAAEIDLRFTGQVVLRPPAPEPGTGHEAPAAGGPPAPRTGGRAG